MAGMVKDDNNVKHRDVRDAERLRIEEYVQKTQQVICSFINPFDVDDKSTLVVISSGAAVPPEISSDILHAERAGKAAYKYFVSSHLETGTNFFQAISRLGLKSFADLNKKMKISINNNKVIQYKEQSNRAFHLLIQSQNEGLQLDLRELMSFPLTIIPYSIGLPGHFMVKTDKSKLFHKICGSTGDAAIPSASETVDIIDGNATFHCLQDIPSNFRQICSKVFSTIPKGDVIFSTDSYMENSIKSMERKRRGVSEKLLIKGSATKKPSDWKFLLNDENKKQFTNILLTDRQKNTYASELHGRRVILIFDSKAYVLSSDDGIQVKMSVIPGLCSSQEETDTRIILYVAYAQSKGYRYARVRSPDSDIFSSCSIMQTCIQTLLCYLIQVKETTRSCLTSQKWLCHFHRSIVQPFWVFMLSQDATAQVR